MAISLKINILKYNHIRYTLQIAGILVFIKKAIN